MRNIRWENGVLKYDCDGVGCPSPGEPHTIPLDEVFAGLETTYKEFLMQEDPRTEILDAMLQFLYESVYSAKNACPLGKAAPWNPALKRLVDMLEGHYSTVEEQRPEKEFMN